jgi:hypothetical protein
MDKQARKSIEFDCDFVAYLLNKYKRTYLHYFFLCQSRLYQPEKVNSRFPADFLNLYPTNYLQSTFCGLQRSDRFDYDPDKGSVSSDTRRLSS